MKPRLFIGSSAESLNTAYIAQELLEHTLEVTVWDQGIFDLSSYTLDSLIASLDKFDGALFVFSPEDELRLRGDNVLTVRDNVLFEFGLFTGRLGRERCFFLIPRGVKNFHLATDLLGMTAATYEAARTDENLHAALGPACNKIKRQLTKLGRILPQYTTEQSLHGSASGVLFLDTTLSDSAITSLLVSRTYNFIFNPPHASKTMKLAVNGTVLQGRNHNEDSWRLSEGKLEFLNAQGQIFSRFNYLAAEDRFVHTNDSDTKSIRFQYLVPLDLNVVSANTGALQSRSPLNKDERIWLEALASRTMLEESVDIRQLQAELSPQLSRSFNPNNIDERFCLKGARLTILGRALINPKDEYVQATNTIAGQIRYMLTRFPGIELLTAKSLSEELKMSEEYVAEILGAISGGFAGKSRFHTHGFGRGATGLESITIDRETFQNYMQFESVEKILEEELANPR